jgi:XTP/dITP diphosphohydrolase
MPSTKPLRFVTTNTGKFREVAGLLAPRGLRVEQVDRPYPEVQADDLGEVASFALRWLARDVPGDFFVDDSGLFVGPLGGFPGVYSSYAFRTIGPKGLLRLLEGGKGRDARFETVIGLHVAGGENLLRGSCAGSIAPEPRGSSGFGFDPIFIPEGHQRTFAEMSVEEKNTISHRGRAASQLVEALGGRDPRR